MNPLRRVRTGDENQVNIPLHLWNGRYESSTAIVDGMKKQTDPHLQLQTG